MEEKYLKLGDTVISLSQFKENLARTEEALNGVEQALEQAEKNGMPQGNIAFYRMLVARLQISLDLGNRLYDAVERGTSFSEEDAVSMVENAQILKELLTKRPGSDLKN